MIDNGQCEDSTAKDVRLMKQRAHVLHGLLKVCVHRADLKVLERYLPPKREYALKVSLVVILLIGTRHNPIISSLCHFSSLHDLILILRALLTWLGTNVSATD